MAYIFNPNRILLRRKLKEIDKYVSGKVLDIASGRTNYRAIFNNWTEYKTLDAHARIVKPDILASAYDIPLADESIDTFICTQAIEHFDEPEKAFKEFKRILKKGGYGVISVPCFENMSDDDNYDFFRFTRDGIKHLAEKYGFKVILVENTSGFFSVRASLLFRYLTGKFGTSSIILSLFFKFYGNFMVWLDKIDKSKVNRRFTIDLVMVVQK